MHLIHTAGVEGVGHHGVDPVLMHSLNSLLGDKFVHLPKIMDYRNYSHTTERFDFEQLLNLHESFGFFSYSYPSGMKNRTPTSFRDLVRTARHLTREGHSLSVIYLRRTMYNALLSKWRPDGSIVNHARVTRDAHNYLEYATRILADLGVSVYPLWYENATSESIGNILTQITGVDAIDVTRHVYDTIFKRSTRDYTQQLSNEQIAEINEAFPGVHQIHPDQ